VSDWKRRQLIRYLMKKHGLTRSEAEAYVNEELKRRDVVKPPIRENDPPSVWDLILILLGAVGVGYAVWRTFQSWSKRKKEREEWVI